MSKTIEFRQHRADGKVSLRADLILGFERLISSNPDEMETTTIIFIVGVPTTFWVDEPYEQVKKKIEQAMAQTRAEV